MEPERDYRPQTSGAAITSLVTGILGWLCLIPIVSPILAIVFGGVGIVSVSKSGGRLAGKGLAITGLILGSAALALHIMLGVFVVSLVRQVTQVVRQMEAIQRKAEAKDWEGVGRELGGGPGAMSQEEITKKFREAETRFGELKNCELAEVEADQERMQRDPFSFPMRIVLNFEAQDGSAHHAMGLIQRIEGKFRLVSLEFRDGRVPVKVQSRRRRP